MAGIDYRISDERETFAALIIQMNAADQKQYESFGNNRAEPVFLNRSFCLYESSGVDSHGDPAQPKILGKVRVANMRFSMADGFEVVFEKEDGTNVIQSQPVAGVPQKLFGLPIFASVPCSFGLKRNHVVHTSGYTRFDISAVVYLKTTNRADRYHAGDIQLETPAKFRRLYPESKWAV